MYSEHPEWRCMRADISDAGSGEEATALVERMVDLGPEDQVALRQSSCFVPRLANWSFPASADEPVEIKARGAYLVTGGLGGLGLEAGRWLAHQGAGQVVLLGRNGVGTDAQRDGIAEMESAGSKVTVATADVANYGELRRCLDQLRSNPAGLPLRGIIHGAGRFDFAMLGEQSLARCREVMAPKVAGAWHLHQLSLHEALDFFIFYSSAAGLLGSLSLAPYAAANSFLDGLAHYRRAQGLVATSINWASFSDAGLATTPEFRRYRSLSQGLRQLRSAEGNWVLDRVLETAPVQVGVAGLDVAKLAEIFPQTADWPYLSELHRLDPVVGEARGKDEALLASLRGCDQARQLELMQSYVRQRVGDIIQIDAGEIDYEAKLFDLGINSLLSLELRNELEVALGIPLSSTLVWTYPTVIALAERCLELLDGPVDGSSADLDDDPETEEEPLALLNYDDALEYINEVLRGGEDE
ncbi:MAG: SDR family NAD(P)-dependent oxidoreductase [Proteobacteria bacterium]|nr:SDR family NAD(P)-dependent oxidoreductase [Pseudomonadota bacterium]